MVVPDAVENGGTTFYLENWATANAVRRAVFNMINYISEASILVLKPRYYITAWPDDPMRWPPVPEAKVAISEFARHEQGAPTNSCADLIGPNQIGPIWVTNTPHGTKYHCRKNCHLAAGLRLWLLQASAPQPTP